MAGRSRCTRNSCTERTAVYEFKSRHRLSSPGELYIITFVPTTPAIRAINSLLLVLRARARLSAALHERWCHRFLANDFLDAGAVDIRVVDTTISHTVTVTSAVCGQAACPSLSSASGSESQALQLEASSFKPELAASFQTSFSTFESKLATVSDSACQYKPGKLDTYYQGMCQ